MKTNRDNYFGRALTALVYALVIGMYALVPPDSVGQVTDTDTLANRNIYYQGATIASAATVDLNAATGDFVTVSGTTTITALGTCSAGHQVVVRFSGILTLTHNATSLILPAAANITTAANDCAIFRSLGSGNWICVSYSPGAGGSGATLAGAESLSNKTLVSPVVSTGLTASGSAANTFASSTGTFITSTGLNTLSGKVAQKTIATPVAAAGSTVSDAGQLGSANVVVVSSDGATKGVKLQTGVAGDVIWVINSSSTACELYAASGGTVNGLSADASIVLPASKGVICIYTAADTWTVYDLTAKATAS
jgi:hypothetical protein